MADLDYGELCRLVFGENFTESNRANVRRAIRALELQGRVRTYFWGASVQCVRLASPGFREPEFPEPRALAEAARHPLLPKAQAESSSLIDGAEVVRGGPVRSLPTYRGQRNYPGLLSTATTQSVLRRGLGDQPVSGAVGTVHRGARIEPSPAMPV